MKILRYKHSFHQIHAVKPTPLDIPASEIWKAYGAKSDSGIFPYYSVTNTENAVKWIVSSKSLRHKGINFSSSLIEHFHFLERAIRASLFSKILFTIKNYFNYLFNRFQPENAAIEVENIPDVIVLIEYCSQIHDLNIFETLLRNNRNLKFEFWISNRKIYKRVRDIENRYSLHFCKQYKKNVILSKCHKSNAQYYNDETWTLFKISRSSLLFKSWKLRFYTLSENAVDRIIEILSVRKPKLIVLPDDTKLFGSICAKAARQLSIPTVLIPHGAPNPFLTPLICDYQTTWSKYWIDIFKEFGMSSSRLVVIGDILSKKPNLSFCRNEKLKKQYGLNGKKIVGYFATPAEPDEPGLWETINLVNKFENVAVIVRPHPRMKGYKKYLYDKLQMVNAEYIDDKTMTLEQFCSISDIIATFESTALYYGIRYGCFPLQVLLSTIREPEVNYQKIANIPCAHDRDEISSIIQSYLDPLLFEKNKITLQSIIKRLWSSYGDDSANELLSFMVKMI